MYRILILGGDGFIGKNLCLSLSKLNFKIFAVVKKRIKKNYYSKKINYLECNINKEKELKKIFINNFDIIINCSGNINHSNKNETQTSHFKVIKNLKKIIKNKKVRLFIQMGSSLEYGFSNSPHKETLRCKPKSHYGKAKYSATKELLSMDSVNVLVLRLYQVYGPHQKINRLIPQTINFCLKNKKFKCTDGKQIRNFLFIGDLVNLIKIIIEKKKIISGIYNVGSNENFSVKYAINKIQKIIRKGYPDYGSLKMRKDEMKKFYPSNKKIKKAFNWKARVDFNSGVKKTIKFYEKNYL